jgi:hypothetical protein
MKPQTQKLLSLRTNSLFVEVKPLKYRAGKPNMCFQNASIYEATRDGYEVVSGWMIGDLTKNFGAICVPHYWLKHLESDEYFDPTPRAVGDEQNYEYIVDMDIYKHVTRTSYIPPPVVIREDGSIQARLGMNRYINLNKIEILELYMLVRD